MKKVIPVLVLALLILPLLGAAQVNNAVNNYPDAMDTICTILETIQNIILAIGLGLAVIFLIIGGIQYLTAGGNAEKADGAKKLIINAIIGIVIILAAAFILSLIQGFLVGAEITIFDNPC